MLNMKYIKIEYLFFLFLFLMFGCWFSGKVDWYEPSDIIMRISTPASELTPEATLQWLADQGFAIKEKRDKYELTKRIIVSEDGWSNTLYDMMFCKITLRKGRSLSLHYDFTLRVDDSGDLRVGP